MRSAEADAKLAKADLDRAQDLAARKVISAAELDTAQSTYTQKKAAVDNMQAAIDKKKIHAPFDGIAGIRAVNSARWSRSAGSIGFIAGARSRSLSTSRCRSSNWRR